MMCWNSPATNAPAIGAGGVAAHLSGLPQSHRTIQISAAEIAPAKFTVTVIIDLLLARTAYPGPANLPPPFLFDLKGAIPITEEHDIFGGDVRFAIAVEVGDRNSERRLHRATQRIGAAGGEGAIAVAQVDRGLKVRTHQDQIFLSVAVKIAAGEGARAIQRVRRGPEGSSALEGAVTIARKNIEGVTGSTGTGTIRCQQIELSIAIEIGHRLHIEA